MSAAIQTESRPQATQACRVAWLPAHPAEGWVSMNRYWLSLARAAQARRDELCVETPLTAGGLVSGRRGRVSRAWSRYVSYPRLVRECVTAPVAHVLDHSYAHLLDFVPRATRTVATVHDLIPLLDPAGLSASQVKRFRKVAMKLHDVDCLVAVSAYTKQTICDLLGIEPDRVVVSHSGVDETFFHALNVVPARVHALPQGCYVLSVGSDVPRKNLRVLPEVLRLLAREIPDVWLVRAGARMSDELTADCRAALPQGRVIELGGVTDDELCALYQRAGALFVPSTFEGWGLPVAEGLASGCPVVCSNVSSLPEAGGGVALMAAPGDVETFAHHLAQSIVDKRLRAWLGLQGRQLSATRTWLRHLDDLADIYRSLV